MYSMVLMAAMVPSGDTVAFGKHKTGSCTGAVYAGCTGTPVVSSYGCCGGSSHSSGGFLGLRHKSGCTGSSYSSSCHGGFLGKHKQTSSCYGSGYGYSSVPVYGCTGGTIGTVTPAVVTPPATPLPKTDAPKTKSTQD